MAESGREQRLREEFLGQTARIRWQELQPHFAAGRVVLAAPTLDLVEVAVQLGLDNTPQFEAWIAAGDIAPVSDAQAQQWYDGNAEFWAVVAPPWVLVQICDAATAGSAD